MSQGARRLSYLIASLLLLPSVSCKKNSLTPINKEQPPKEVVEKEQPNRSFVAFDKGILSYDQHIYHEESSVAPRIYHFDADNRLTQDVLAERNPYARWGYTGFLHYLPNIQKFLLCSSMLRVNTVNNSSAPEFKPNGRMSVVSARTFDFVKQLDYVAYVPEVGYFPDEVFAFDDRDIYLFYKSESKTTYKVSLDAQAPSRQSVASLEGRNLSSTYVLNGKMYALDYDYDSPHLIAFDPADSSCKVYDVGKPSRVITWEDDRVYLAYRDGSLGIYSLTKGEFIVDPVIFGEKYGAVYGAALDRKTNSLYLSFDDPDVRPYIFKLHLSGSLKGKTDAEPVKYAKLDLLTSDTSSGKTRLFVDKYQHKLFAFYHHSERKGGLGGMVNIYNLKGPDAAQLATPEHHYRIGRDMCNITIAYSIPNQ